jgi:hypothetical protein
LISGLNLFDKLRVNSFARDDDCKSSFLGWKWGFWGKCCRICKTLQKSSKASKKAGKDVTRRCKTFAKAAKDRKKLR